MRLVNHVFVIVLCVVPLHAASFNFVHMISGNHLDLGFSVARDPQGFIYVAGITSSSDFETSPGAYQTEPVPGPNGPSPFVDANAFVRKLSPDGARTLYSTYLGPAIEGARTVDIEVDAQGHVYAAVQAVPTGSGATQPERLGRVVVYKLSPTGDQLLHSARILPNTHSLVAIDVDNAGAVYVASTGLGVHIRKLDPTGTAIEYEHLIAVPPHPGEELGDIVLGPDRSLYIVGTTRSPEFPVTPDAYVRRSTNPTHGDVFLVRLDPTGTERLLSSVFGGGGQELRPAVALDASGNIYVAGKTHVSSVNPRMEGDLLGFPEPPERSFLGFIVKLDPSGSTALYTALTPFPMSAVGVDAEGQAYAAGSSDAVISALRLNEAGTRLVSHSVIPASAFDLAIHGIDVTADWRALIGGATRSIAIPDTGPPILGESNAFFAEINETPAATDLQIQGEIAPAEIVSRERLTLILTVSNLGPAPAENVVVSLPPQSNLSDLTYRSCRASADGFCLGFRGVFRRIPPGGVEQVKVTFDPRDRPPSGTTLSIRASVSTSTSDTSPANNSTLATARYEYVRLSVSTFPGGLQYEIDDSPQRSGFSSIFVRPNTPVRISFPPVQIHQFGGCLPVKFKEWSDGSKENPRTFQIGEEELRVFADFSDFHDPYVEASGVVNSASFLGGSVAPGLISTFFGLNIGSSVPVPAKLDSEGRVARELDGFRVLFDGVAAPVVFTSCFQSSLIVPYAVHGKQQTSVRIEYRGRESAEFQLPVADTAPGLFTANASGWAQAAAFNQDFTLNSRENPAALGEIIVLYGTGEGLTDPVPLDGALAGGELPKPVLPVSVTIGAEPAKILYAGGAPTLTAGLLQLNARIPASIETGNHVPVSFEVGGVKSQKEVTIAVALAEPPTGRVSSIRCQT